MKANLLLNILVFALLAPEVAFAVTTPVVKGRVVDEEERPVEYANHGQLLKVQLMSIPL